MSRFVWIAPIGGGRVDANYWFDEITKSRAEIISSIISQFLTISTVFQYNFTDNSQYSLLPSDVTAPVEARSPSAATNGSGEPAIAGQSPISRIGADLPTSPAQTTRGLQPPQSDPAVLNSAAIAPEDTATYVVPGGGTLDLGGAVAAGQTISFIAPAPSTLILGDPSGFDAAIAGIATGDRIILQNTTDVVPAEIGGLNGVPTLQILQSSDGNPYDATELDIPVEAATQGDYLRITSSGADTVLTLSQGNPIALSIDAAAARQTYDVDGAGITIGIISDSFNTLGGETSDIAAGVLSPDITILPGLAGDGSDEGRALAQIIYDIAPGAAIDFATGDASPAVFATAVQALQAAGCRIIVDDEGFDPSQEVPNGVMDQAIDAAVDAGVTYVTAAGNDRNDPVPLPVYGHSADPLALTVAAMSILATPSVVGGYIPTQTEPFSSMGTTTTKPDITGPVAGPTTFPLDNGPNPFFGTSAAAPAVAAVAALMMQANPLLETDPLNLDHLLEATATSFPDASIPAGSGITQQQTEGAGLVDALAAVAAATITAADLTLCFCRGTLIRTPRGEVPVQDLATGETVLTQSGQVRSVIWIGTGQVLATRGRRSAATPVIVQRNALADNVPHTDLYVTKGHAFLIDGVLIPVEFLVNHRSIRWDDRAQGVSVYHVELSAHDILLANGAPAESYRDDGNRWLFQNANSGWGAPPCQPCAPVLTGGPVVDRIWRRLLDRSGRRPGLPTTQDPDLHLRVDGSRLDATETHGPAHIFALPANPAAVHIVSRAAAPAELGLARDPRVLGVALRRIALRRGTRFRLIDVADPALAEGFHRFEPDQRLRWTDGDAHLPAALFAPPGRPQELVLTVGATAHYPLFGAAA